MRDFFRRYLRGLPDGTPVQTLDEVASWTAGDWRLLIARRRRTGEWTGRVFSPDGCTYLKTTGATALRVYRSLTRNVELKFSRGRRTRLPRRLGREVRRG